MTDTKPEDVLALTLPENDSGADTVRGYLIALLVELWNEGEGFSGKRPFGNSGWEYDLYAPMVRAGFVEGTFDSDGYLDKCDRPAADVLMLAAIGSLGEAQDA